MKKKWKKPELQMIDVTFTGSGVNPGYTEAQALVNAANELSQITDPVKYAEIRAERIRYANAS